MAKAYVVRQLPTTGIDPDGTYYRHEDDGSGRWQQYRRDAVNQRWQYLGEGFGVITVNGEAGVNVDVSGSTGVTPIATKTESAIIATNEHTIIANAVLGSLTMSLPIDDVETGKMFTIKGINIGDNIVSVNVVDNDALIDGGFTVILGQPGALVTVQFDGSNYWIVGGNYWTVS